MPIPKENDEKYIRALTERIKKLIKASSGHSLILFTSYKVLNLVYQFLDEIKLEYPVFKLLKGDNETISKYKQSGNGVLLASGAVWEGINFPGDILSHLIIVKLPFQVPDPLTNHIKGVLKDDSKFNDVVLIPKMLIKLRQGYGRAIRSETDTAVISILDTRASGRYKNRILSALPKCDITHEIEEIRKFIQEKKSPEYFYASKGGK